MKHICVLAVLHAVVAVAQPVPIEAVPADPVPGLGACKVVRPNEWVDRSGEPGPVWEILEGMGQQDRYNAVINFDLGLAQPEAWAEARAVEQLWNTGDYEGAIERLRMIGIFHDPCDIDVGMSWREPIPTIVGTDWGDNVRVGNRDSVYEIEMDRNNRTGNLFLVSVRDTGTMSAINLYMSTNNGQDWSETYNRAVSVAYINAIGAASNGDYVYVGYTRDPNQTLGRVMCFRADSGTQVRFPNDSFFRTMFQADPNDTITEIEMASADDEFPASRLYAAGCTKGRKLLWGWTDSSASNWRNNPRTAVSYCDGGLALTYNYHFQTGKPFVWATWIYNRNNDTNNVGFGRLTATDTVWYRSWFHPGFDPTYTSTTVASWGDTTCIVYVHGSGTKRYLRQIYTYNAGTSWSARNPLDTTTVREHPFISSRYGRGFQLAARQYTDTTARDLVFSRTTYAAQSWSTPWDISDYRPALADPQVMLVSPGTYGCSYIKWYGRPQDYSIWYNRSDWTGVEDVTKLHPRFGLRATFGRNRARLKFDNPRQGPVTLRVYDPAGRLVSMETRRLGPGEQELDVKVASSGVHFAVVDIDGKTETARLTFAH
ncbi:MAG: T9SS type A sorting domain-containing protein [candidate division WOR-3 bacterium]|nr:MAG: T9SS type A sorting domain-containing protein [candidate division WOR-3 bacterium]